MSRLNVKPATVCFVLGVSLIMTLCLSAHAGDGWPLRNGDFSRDQYVRHVIRPDWRHNFGPGTKVFREHRDPREPVFEGRWWPGALNLQATNPDNPAAVFQEPWLLPGEYTFRLQARTEGGINLLVSAGSGKTTYSGDGWADVAVNFSVPKAGTVTVRAGTEAAGNAKLRDARIDVHKVEGAPVPLADGRVLGAIVLAKEPTEAERYAAWELQKFIFRMTGKAPGVTGRDATAEGVRIYLGGAADDEARARLAGVNEDGYVVEHRGDALFLAGTNDRGTLYAAYDFLKQQGCGWYWPGPSGEIVPARSALAMPSEVRVESPDWVIRGMDKKRPSSGRWIQLDDYIDWLVRNRQNAFLASQSLTIDFGKWRGGSHGLRTNHTVAGFWWKDGEPIKPEWAPLVLGVRKPRSTTLSGGRRHNAPCTSNQDLRDRTVELALKFFEQRPEISVFGVNVQDGHVNWCECAACRAQDPDQGKDLWKLDARDGVPQPITDRWMNYVNEVAERVGKVYPDKFIETYAYADIRPQTSHLIPGRLLPLRERVLPNVMVRFLLYVGESPYGVSLRNQADEGNAKIKQILDGWRAAGAQNMALYDYDNYVYPDIVYTYFYRMADSMRVLHDDYGMRTYVAEQHILITAASHMAHNLRARLLWDADADYRQVIREVCDGLYGPAADTMYDYYCHMDQVVLDYWKKNFGTVKSSGPGALGLQEYTFADMTVGKALLDKAWKEIGDDRSGGGTQRGRVVRRARLRDPVARVRFGHAVSTLAMAKAVGGWGWVHEGPPPGTRTITPETERQAREAWQLARDLRDEYGFLGSKGLSGLLKKPLLLPAISPTEEIIGQVEKELELDCGAGVTMKLALIPAGEFMMGSPPSEIGRADDEGPQHRVRISSPFYMGKYEVTQAQYEAVMGNDPASSKGAKSPFTGASWYDAVEFCKRLSVKTGMTVRLPTEAEWEYACRAGTTTVFCFGDTISTDQANYNGDDAYGSGPKGVYRRNTTAVGSFSANRFGLYDMHGNAWEWCQDWYDQDSYLNSPTSDPPGPANGQYRVLRGGSWSHDPRRARSAYRGILDPADAGCYGRGLRICVVVPE